MAPDHRSRRSLISEIAERRPQDLSIYSPTPCRRMAVDASEGSPQDPTTIKLLVCKCQPRKTAGIRFQLPDGVDA